VRPILLLLLVGMIASAIWLSFGRVEAQSERVGGASAPSAATAQAPLPPASQAESAAAFAEAEAALHSRIAAQRSDGLIRISNDEASTHLSEAHVPQTLHALRDRFTEAYIALLASGTTRQAALAELAEIERDAIAHAAGVGH